MRGAGAHSVAKCRGLGGYYRVAVSHVGRDGVRALTGINHGEAVRHTVEASPFTSRNCALLLKVPARVSHWSS